MKLKELKKSSLYQSSDLDEMELMICVARNGEPQYEPLCFMGWTPLETNAGGIVIIGGLTEVQRRVECGEMQKPEGYIDSKKTKDLIEGSGKNMNDFERSRIFNLGWEAYWKNASLDENPYSGEEADEWTNGWWAAKNADER